MRIFHSFCCYLLSLSIFVASIQYSYAQAPIQAPVNCNVRSEVDFRFRLENILKNVIGDALKSVNYKGIVDKSWQENNVNKLIDRLVKKHVKRLRKEKSILQLMRTLGSSRARVALAKELAESVFGSQEFRQVIKVVANDVGTAISAKLDTITTNAANPVSQCISKFLGPRYGEAIAVLVTKQTRNEMTVDASKQRSGAGVTDILSESAGGLTGALLIVLRRAIVDRLSRWLGRKLVGTIVTRAIGAVVSFVGWLLILKDIWDLRLGILPIIGKGMRSQETKDEVKAELVRSVDEELAKALEGVPRDVAASMFKIWSDFKRKHTRVLQLARLYPKFQTLLNELRSSDEKLALQMLRKTNNLVNLSIEIGGEKEFLRLLGNGTLKQAIIELSETGVLIAVDTKSIEKAFQWSKVARSSLQKIYNLKLHKYINPNDYNEEKLEKLLSLKDENIIKRFTVLSQKERDILFELPPEQYKDFIRKLTARQLSSLSFYIKALQPDVSRRFIRGVRDDPDRMKLFAKPLVRKGVLSSKDQDAAIAYILREDSPFEILKLPEDIRLASNGDISPMLIWSKAPITVTLAAFLVLFFFLMLLRALFGRRQKIIIETRSEK